MAEALDKLLERCRRGEDRAIALLVARFQAYAHDLASAILGDGHLAEDAVQEAFLASLRRLSDLREPAAFPGWFRQIVRTQACRLARRRREDLHEAPDDKPADDPTPLDRLEHEELREHVRRALASLPRTTRETAERFYLEERHHAEVAEMLQVPTGTVKRRLYDARQRLRDMLLGYVAPAEPMALPEDRPRDSLPL